MFLSKDCFKFTAPGRYEFEGVVFEITDKKTGFGSGKKTVYSSVIEGVTYTDKDITFYKRFFKVPPYDTDAPRTPRTKKAPVPAESKPAPIPAPVPSPAPVKPAKKAEIRHAEFNTVRDLVKLDIPVYLYGPAGSGKNVICKQIADDLGLDFYFSNSVTQEYKITGFIDANGRFHETEFYKAFKNGGLFMLDELDASIPEVLIALNAALANRYFEFPNGRISAHPDFRVIAAGNTCGRGASEEYNGRYQIDAATMDRFAFVNIEYDTQVENAITGGNMDILHFVREMRKAAAKIGLNIVLGYRALQRLTQMAAVFTPARALEMAILKGIDTDTRNALRAAYSGSIYNPYFKAL